MKFYLSSDRTLEEPLSVRVNNIQRKRKKDITQALVSTPDEKLIVELNKLASKPPFCVLHRVKKHDTF